MSALAAVLRFGGGAEPRVLCERLLGGQSARGPDQQSRFANEDVALGVGHLFRSRQHRVNDHRVDHALGNFHIAWDGRLDNRVEIADALGVDRQQLPGDGALVALAWAYWGVGTPDRLLGDFAFAIWDGSARHLYCVRDPIGARPCYYTHQRDFFAIASEDDALTQLPGVSAEWHPDRLVYGALPQFTGFDWSQSWRKDVKILMPGCMLAVDRASGVRLHTYHRWPNQLSQFLGDDREAAEEFGRLIRSATRDRMMQLDKVGAIASGGLDSLCVATAASLEANQRRVAQFSLVHDQIDSDLESRSIAHSADRLGLQRHWTYVPSMTGECDEADLERVLSIRHPVDESIPPIGLMCLAARRAGLASLMTGVSGDCVLAAPNRYLWDIWNEWGLREALAEARRASSNHAYLRGCNPALTLSWYALRENAPDTLRRVWRRLRRGRLPKIPTLTGESRTQECLQREYERRSVIASEAAADVEKQGQVASYFEGIGAFGVLRGLEGYERVAGRYGIELADPFADRRVIEFCATLPSWQLSGAGFTKIVGRNWVSRFLDAEFVYRSDKPHLGDLLPRPDCTP